MVNENIDSDYKTGGKSEKRKAWSSWVVKHFGEMKIAKVAGLFPKQEGWRNVVEHSLVVNATAVFIARKIAESTQVINLELVDTASILHDIAKRKDKENKVKRDDVHTFGATGILLKDYPAEVVRAAQYSGRVQEIFQSEEDQELAIRTKPIEDLIIAYADARTRNTNIVSLEEARDMNKQKIPSDADFYDKWYSFYHKLETRLISLANIKPSDISEENIFQMVKEEKTT
jgi:putative nucleotidyltransferase with HDIG domain